MRQFLACLALVAPVATAQAQRSAKTLATTPAPSADVSAMVDVVAPGLNAVALASAVRERESDGSLRIGVAPVAPATHALAVVPVRAMHARASGRPLTVSPFARR